ncbi:MAG TPA: hypothetical protein VN950_03295 [Terriglobales bacterium]|nr:hypothetical protein [Terriglobales bacterium]
MANQSGQIYGLTVLSPILERDGLDISHATALRWYLAGLPRDHTSPLARVSGTHFARLVVMDDVVFVGAPAREEHLKSRYLIFETNFDGDLDPYLIRMAQEVPDFVNSVWQHCVGYPGVADLAAFATYMKKCQIETTFFFADVNNKTVQENLKALQVQSALGHFVESNQGKPAAEVQKSFGLLLDRLAKAPAPLPGGIDSEKTAAEDRPYD